MLMTHYRQPIDWTLKKLVEAESSLKAFSRWTSNSALTTKEVYPPFLEALCDDLNTPQAITELYNLVRQMEWKQSDAEQARRFEMLENSLWLLGFETLSEFKPKLSEHLPEDERLRIDILVAARTEARKAKDFKEADRVRDELAAMGVVIKDSKDGTTWELKR